MVPPIFHKKRGQAPKYAADAHHKSIVEQLCDACWYLCKRVYNILYAYIQCRISPTELYLLPRTPLVRITLLQKLIRFFVLRNSDVKQLDRNLETARGF